MDITSSLVYLLIALISVIVFYIKHHLSFWKLRGIPHDAPSFPRGSMDGFLKTRHLRDILQTYYSKYKSTGPFGGFFFFLKPTAMIFDLDLVRDILIKDFQNFSHRGLFYNEKDDPLTGHLFFLDGPKWKHLRNKLSPTFTSGKMKFMFPTVLSVADKLLETINETIEQDSLVEMKDILARFTVDIIGTCAFGIECNSLRNPKAEFRTIGAKAFILTRHSKVVDGLLFSFPELARKLHMRQIHEEIHQFYMGVVRDTVAYREKNCIKRNDFMDLLIELKNSKDGLTIEEVAAQAFIFFLAGFETSSTTMGFALFELASNQEIQEKLRAEIDSQYKKNNGELTYECMAEMHYMEKVIKETLRKHPPVLNLIRKSLNDYPTSNPKYVIPKGKLVLIPVDAIHHDPDVYPDPEKFDPERFSPQEIVKRHPTSWLPFGDGPRNCIGLRFGKMQTHVGLTMLLRNYRFYLCEKTKNPMELDLNQFVLAVKGGIYLRVERVNCR